MRTIRPLGPYRDMVEALSPDNSALVVKLGLRTDSFQQSVHNALRTAIAQYFGIVQDGLLHAAHAFRGLKRPLMHGDDMNADKSVIAYSWRPSLDYEWSGSRHDGNPVAKTPLGGRVFVVLVREEQPNEYNILGSLEHWSWIEEDRQLRDAPVDWKERYAEKLWSR
jgi:hypothetical protein